MGEGPPGRSSRIETSAGGIVYRPGEEGPRILLIRDRNANWGFPKGHLEPGETAEAAALREIREETGLDDLQVETRLRTIDWRFRFRGALVHKYCHFFLVRSPGGEPEARREEGIVECRWLPLEAALERVTFENARGVLREAASLFRVPEGGGPA